MKCAGSLDKFEEEKGQAIVKISEEPELEEEAILDFDNGASIEIAEVLDLELEKHKLNRDNVEKKWYFIWRTKEPASEIVEKQGGYEKVREFEADLNKRFDFENGKPQEFKIIRW